MKFTNETSSQTMYFSTLNHNDLFMQVSDGYIFQKRRPSININDNCNAFDFANNCMVTFRSSDEVKRVKIIEIKFVEI